MTQLERSTQSTTKELEKRIAAVERTKKALEKKEQAAAKLNMNITEDEWYTVRDTATQEQAYAYLMLSIARGNAEEAEHKLQRTQQTQKQLEVKVANAAKKLTAEEAEKQIADEIARWAEAGITVTMLTSNFIAGTTPKGKYFTIDGNNGVTERSRYCFSVRVGGEQVFTSGQFYTAFKAIKNS